MSQAPIKVDPITGYRAVDRTQTDKPAQPDQNAQALLTQLQQLQAQFTQLQQKFDTLKNFVDGIKVTGDGHTGTAASGMMFTPQTDDNSENQPTLVNFEFCDGSSGDVEVFNYVPAP